jgi:ubiquinone/menaquinone biosynthesis C-methylase UbiE
MPARAPARDASEDVREFFEVRAPALLSARPELARDINGRCVFDVGGGANGADKWVVDFTTDPPTVRDGDGDGAEAGDAMQADCQMALSAEQFLELIADPAAGQVLAWQGRLRIAGDQSMLRRVGELLFPGGHGENTAMSGYYASISRLIPDSRLTFMNYGYVEHGDDFAWCDEADQPWRYAINLIRRALAGVDVAGARVLDVGCGRGGPAAYIAGRLDAREVVGLDASEDGVRFCREQHVHPRLRFVHASAEELPFEDASFDVVLNVESSHCYLRPAAFFSEVARVLKPGGSFCYSDVLLPDQFERMRRLLADTPGLSVRATADITPQVARAIELNRMAFAALMQSATDAHRGNQSLIANLVRTVNVDAYERLRTGRVGYYAWTIKKEAR